MYGPGSLWVSAFAHLEPVATLTLLWSAEALVHPCRSESAGPGRMIRDLKLRNCPQWLAGIGLLLLTGSVHCDQIRRERRPAFGVALIVGVVGFLDRQAQELMAGLGVLVGGPAPQNGPTLPRLCRRCLTGPVGCCRRLSRISLPRPRP